MFYGGIIVIGLTVLITVLVMTLSQIRRSAKGVEELTDSLGKEIGPTMSRMRDLLERMSSKTRAFDNLSEGVEAISGSVKKLSSLADGSGNSSSPPTTIAQENHPDESALNMASEIREELRSQMSDRIDQAKNEMMKTVVEEILTETRKMVEEEAKKLESVIETGRQMFRRERGAAQEPTAVSEDYRRGNPAEE